ncbi:uncharacterized protein LOC129750645 [Uranotaenia lowii]|uniref:uncharacterized protein LOC129750645 n=1 Tax=Uranotaenia lowii TaxID=190385 RepID=UPI002479CEA5|nr:uncharacterized protein LOC129750645 [Uranotaenia lowii]
MKYQNSIWISRIFLVVTSFSVTIVSGQEYEYEYYYEDEVSPITSTVTTTRTTTRTTTKATPTTRIVRRTAAPVRNGQQIRQQPCTVRSCSNLWGQQSDVVVNIIADMYGYSDMLTGKRRVASVVNNNAFSYNGMRTVEPIRYWYTQQQQIPIIDYGGVRRPGMRGQAGGTLMGGGNRRVEYEYVYYEDGETDYDYYSDYLTPGNGQNGQPNIFNIWFRNLVNGRKRKV